MALFSAGSFLLRGAGCTVNDLWDRELDREVERTRMRPLASGALTSTQAIGWLGAQLSAGLAILLQLNPYAQVLGASSLALVATYPLMKRITGWPQVNNRDSCWQPQQEPHVLIIKVVYSTNNMCNTI